MTLTRVERWFFDEKLILGAILVNAAVLFALSFPQIPHRWLSSLDRVDDLFTVLFFTELLVKVRRLGLRGYLASHWNKFDFLLVMISMPSLLFEVLGMDVHSNALLGMRVGRAFKFFRSLRFVPGIDTMLEGITRALRASLMLLVGFAIGLFMVALLSTKLFSGVAPEHYGDPLRALYSTFKIFTVEGWFDIPDEVAGQLQGVPRMLTQVFFSGVLLVCGILGLSLVNSVFVDAMVADNNDALEKKVDSLSREIALLREALGAHGGSSLATTPPPATPSQAEPSAETGASR